MVEENNINTANDTKRIVEFYLENASKKEREETSFLIALGQTNLIIQRAREFCENYLKNANVQNDLPGGSGVPMQDNMKKGSL